MGCGRSSNSHNMSKNVKNYKVNLDIGVQVKRLGQLPEVIFVFGGPGSKKGRIVEDLVRMYGFKLINAEDVLLNDALSSSEGNQCSMNNEFSSIKKYIKENPSVVCLESLLEGVKREIQKRPEDSYVVNLVPNLKSFIHIEQYSRNCNELLKRFEDTYPISFALNMAIPAEKVIKKVEAESAKHSSTSVVPGEQTDEADSTRTQKRALHYQTSVTCFLDYFGTSSRLVTVDVSCGITSIIWDKVREFFNDLHFNQNSLINITVIFTFCNEDRQLIDATNYDVKEIRLNAANRDDSGLLGVLDWICNEIHSNCSSYSSFLIDVSDTSLLKDIKEQTEHVPKFLDNSSTALEKLICPENKIENLPDYKVFYTTENDMYLFPKTIDENICQSIVYNMNEMRLYKRDETS